MSRKSNIVYDPKLSIEENAAKNNVSVAGIYYYLRSQNLDRNQDRASGIVKEIQKVLKKDPTLSQAKVAKELGRSVTTINKYWKVAAGEKELVPTKEIRAEVRANKKELQTIGDITPRVFDDILKTESFSENIRLAFEANTILPDCTAINGHSILSSARGKADVIGCPTLSDVSAEHLKESQKGCSTKVALLLPLSILSDSGKYTEVFKTCPPSRIYAYTSSIGENTEILGYAWFVWEKDVPGTDFKWIQPVCTIKQKTVKSTKPTKQVVDVPLTDDDRSEAKIAARRIAVGLAKLNRPRVEKIFKGIEIQFEEHSYPINEVILYSSKMNPVDRVLGHHYECLITFRGVEFYGVEQLHSALKFNERPYIMNDIMTAKSGTDAKSRSHAYDVKHLCLYDSNYNAKDRRITGLCFLFKYLSVPEFRNRLRELRNATLVEAKGAYEGGLKMDDSKTHYLTSNSDGRLMMAVRDLMLQYEDKALDSAKKAKGATLSEKETESVLSQLYKQVREEFENDPQIKADSDNIIEYIKAHTDIIPLKREWSKEGARAILVEFDNCLFDTSADDNDRKAGVRVSFTKSFYKERIPKYTLHNGWAEVIAWAEQNNVMIGVLGKAKSELVRNTCDYYDVPCEAVVYAGKPNVQHGYELIDEMKLRPEQVLCYVSGYARGAKQAEENGFKFYGATWDTIESFGELPTISSPKDIINLFSKK